MEEEKTPDILERFSAFMERDTRGEEILTYGLAGIGLLTALYKIRPFAKFTKPSQVPKHFFKKKVVLEGVVHNVEPGEQPYLLVDHKPLVPIPRLGNPKFLPVKVAGVNVTGSGISWLQTVVKGQKITFLPIHKDDKFLACIVMVPQKEKDPICVGKELVRVGFGTVSELHNVSTEDKELKLYEKSLLLAQKWAEKRRNGIWFYKYSPTIFWRVRNSIDNKLKNTLPVFMVKYLNI
ncbi:hypothetical protein QAD02_004965 [Eretmocerus hayati]|uniref:Uncharacterized protein n=1 Tax=Eretmocerus hayati TaxID=131215 RepID=A0ACC2NR77_9HYME|nr:hypothetical protein QAD02_004965 [Eretmocerus hayati]